jgi:hypothetical protein
MTVAEFRRIWRFEIFPLQWRISISWISGYFIFQLLTPLVFYRFGPVLAGQLGFAISAMSSILFVSTTFSSSVAPRLASLFHSSSIIEFNALFDVSFRRSFLAIVFFTQLFVLLVYFIHLIGGDMSDRFLPWDQLFVYSLSVIMSSIVYCWSIYLRAQSIEPLMALSAMAALVMALMLWFSSFFSVTYMLIAMLLVTAFSSMAAWRIYSDNRNALGGVP